MCSGFVIARTTKTRVIGRFYSIGSIIPLLRFLNKSIHYSNSKESESFWFFSLNNVNLGAHFLLSTFLITSISKSLYFLKWCPSFDIHTPILKMQWFPLSMLIFNQKPFNFVSLSWNLCNRYCHIRYQIKHTWIIDSLSIVYFGNELEQDVKENPRV